MRHCPLLPNYIAPWKRDTLKSEMFMSISREGSQIILPVLKHANCFSSATTITNQLIFKSKIDFQRGAEVF
jgi:hypothetical protein